MSHHAWLQCYVIVTFLCVCVCVAVGKGAFTCVPVDPEVNVTCIIFRNCTACFLGRASLTMTLGT